MKKNEAQSQQKETVKKSEMLKRKRRTRIEKEESVKPNSALAKGCTGQLWTSGLEGVGRQPGNQHTGSRPRGASRGRTVNQCSKSCTELISELGKPHTKGQNSRINRISPAQE